ncbi:MAG: tyrosine-type recombinase/integrase [Bryobacteraceae bacterium]
MRHAVPPCPISPEPNNDGHDASVPLRSRDHPRRWPPCPGGIGRPPISPHRANTAARSRLVMPSPDPYYPESSSFTQPEVYLMIRRRASGAGIKTLIGCHTFRATGITAYLKNGGKLEVAQQMAAHESARTTGLYDRRGDEISLDEVERIAI